MSGLGMDQDMESPYESLAKWRDKAARQKEHIAGQARSIVRLKEENAKLRHDMSEALSRMVSVKPAPVVRPECHARMEASKKRRRIPSDDYWMLVAIGYALGMVSGYMLFS